MKRYTGSELIDKLLEAMDDEVKKAQGNNSKKAMDSIELIDDGEYLRIKEGEGEKS